jgi:2-oxo-4-hydroxy-4-carboxy-5-ureidoimidazoline decarboxylase
VLAELRRRLANDEAAERAEVTEQLAQITGLRVEGLVAGAMATDERASRGALRARRGTSPERSR